MASTGRIRASVLSFFLMMFAFLSTAMADAPMLLVVPARHTMIQFALDMLKLRPMYLMAFDIGTDAKSASMHLWDGETGEWVSTSVEEYRDGTAFAAAPEKVILAGNVKDLPPGLLDAPAWARHVRRVGATDIVALVNALNDDMEFTTQEWRWIAARYELKLKNLNEERNRYGRYGKP